MCCVCRQRFQKDELIRIAKTGDKVSFDCDYRAGGRGAYICKNPDCIKSAQKKKSFSRNLRADVEEDIYNKLLHYAEDTSI